MRAENFYKELKARIKGPVLPVVMPFTEEQDVDFDALGKYADFLAEAGAPVILLTVGTSRFNLLTDDEMLQANKVVVDAVHGRSVVVAAGPGPSHGSTKQNIEFAQQAGKAGADGILLLYPERWYGDAPVVKFFHDIADSTDIGIMIHAVAMRDGFGGVKAVKYLDADLLEKIVQRPNFIGIKEENGDRTVFEEILKRYNQNLPVIGAGGAMRRFIGDHKLGSYTYLEGVGSFKPKLVLEFYDAVMAGNETKALEMAAKYEDEYFALAVKLGWHRALKETLYQMGLMPPFEREPFDRIDDAERAQLREVLLKCGWLDQ
jgi:4-hydroxy-tetrahydrodipicolinate synthase